ncbi:FHA domain-containing protein [Jannaschia sp. LMIT008]|uniref:FHA domain-containing protein n=1 Tax=Jannaschia maritima TaxID=3032585 RepID=UPI0028126477|nr:FHA domain-containing protein [Jannaschia sp. LMIT008]
MPANLRILDGLHAGARADLPPGSHMVGSADGDDVVLLDDGILPGHLRVVVAGDGMRIEAAGEACTFEAGPQLPEGNVASTTTPCVLEAGGIRIAFDPGMPDPRRTGPALWLAASLAAATAIWTIFPTEPEAGCRMLGSCAGNPIETAPRREARSLDAPKRAPIDPIPILFDAAIAPARPAPQGPAHAEAELASGLAQAIARHDLNALDYTLAPGLVRFSGELGLEAMGRFRALQRRLDEDHPGLVLDSSDVVAVAERAKTPPLPRISALWHIKDPYALIEGQRFTIGETLADGWVVEAIGAYDLTLRFDDHRVTVRMD